VARSGIVVPASSLDFFSLAANALGVVSYASSLGCF